MRTTLLSLALLAGSAGAAFADGIFGGCDEDHDGTWNCSDGDQGGQCNVGKTTEHNALGVGTSLALLGFVVHRVTRRRRR